jgi:hypothetical protein
MRQTSFRRRARNAPVLERRSRDVPLRESRPRPLARRPQSGARHGVICARTIYLRFETTHRGRAYRGSRVRRKGRSHQIIEAGGALRSPVELEGLTG